MDDLAQAVDTAFRLLATGDRGLFEIIALSLQVNLTAVAVAAAIALPVGAALALYHFPGRRPISILISALMGLPPVVVGLLVYLTLSRSGPLGVFALLYSPTAMIIAQVVIVTPIIASLTRQTIEQLWEHYSELLRSLGAAPGRALPTLLWEGRVSLITAILVGLGRAMGEVGAVMVVGGNIDHVTRVMTTAIALETSRGDLPLAMGLGMVLMTLSLIINASAFGLRRVIGD